VERRGEEVGIGEEKEEGEGEEDAPLCALAC